MDLHVSLLQGDQDLIDLLCDIKQVLKKKLKRSEFTFLHVHEHSWCEERVRTAYGQYLRVLQERLPVVSTATAAV